MNVFSEKSADRSFEVPASYIFQFKHVKDKSRRVLVEQKMFSPRNY